MKVVDQLLSRLGFADSLYRGTMLTANMVMTSMIATMPGFGSHGILISSFIQLSINGVLEIPTGVFSDRYGWYRSIRYGLWLKVLSTSLFLAATIEAFYFNTGLAWLLIATEAIVDAFASSFINGAYQSAYQKWFDLEAEKRGTLPEERVHPFLRSFKFSIYLRILLPAISLALGYVLYRHFAQVSVAVPIALLSYLLVLRFFVIAVIRRDLRTLPQLERQPRDSTKIVDMILLSLKHSPQLLALYGFFTFLVVATGSYLLGQTYHLLMSLNFDYKDTWVSGTAIAFAVHVLITFISRFLFPRLASVPNERKVIRFFFASLLMTGITALIAYAMGGPQVQLLAVIGFGLAMLVLGQAGQRWLITHVSHVPSQYRATWFSVADVCGMLFFGAVSGLILLSGFADSAVEILIGQATLGTAVFLAIFWRSNLAEATKSWTLQRYLNACFLVAISLFSVVGAIWETRSFISKSLELKRESEKIMVSLFETSIREPVIQGALVESAAQAKRLMDANPSMCVSLAIGGEGVMDCEPWKARHAMLSEVNGAIFFERENAHKAGQYSIYFDQSDIYNSARTRFFIVLFLFSAMGVIVWLTIRAASLRIFRELNELLNWKQEGRRSYTFLISEFSQISDDLKRSFLSELEASTIRTLHAANRQVAHDIRSPLTAIAMVEKDLHELPESKRILLRSAMDRIRDIANSLLDLNASLKVDSRPTMEISAEESSTQLLTALVEPLMTEKRLQFRSKIGIQIREHLHENAYGLFAKVQPTEFKRVLSNLVNNSIEAMDDSGKVDVELDADGDHISVAVKDNGKGIAEDVLPSLGTPGKTHGKLGGHGLGLYHAKRCIELWGGSFKIESKMHSGTSVTIQLPRAEAPRWFVQAVRIVPNTAVVVFDDDASIHQIWKRRFAAMDSAPAGLSILHFSTPADLRKWYQNSATSNSATYLLDYELMGFQETGLDLCIELNLTQNAILVTSRFEDHRLQERCDSLGLKLLPKGLAEFVPIEIVDSLPKIDAILIDDDRLVHSVWQMAAKDQDKNIQAFLSPQEFFHSAFMYDKSVPIYIDSNLGSNLKGEDISKKIYDLGFQNLFLTTGYSANQFKPMPWLKGIVGKDPLF